MEPAQERTIVELLSARLGARLLAVYLHGSRAEGRARADSDVDLAVLADGALDAVMRFDLEQDLATALHAEVDLLDLRSAPAFLRGRVAALGQTMLIVDEFAAAEFETLALCDYARLHEESGEVIAAFDARYER